MNKKNILIFLIAGLALLVVIFVYFIWDSKFNKNLFSQDLPKESLLSSEFLKERSVISSLSQRIIKPLNFVVSDNLGDFLNKKTADNQKREDSAKKDADYDIFFEKIKTANKIVEGNLSEEDILKINEKNIGIKDIKTGDNLIDVLPKDYLDTVSNWQDEMIKINSLSEEDKIKFERFSDVTSFLEKMTVALAEKEVISKNDKDNLLHGLKVVWPNILIMEQNFSKAENNEKISGNLSFQIFINWFREIFMPKAAAVVCFRPGGLPVVPGPNLWAPGCWTMCGKVPCGCLNKVCNAYPAAIYDITTGICGCG